MCSMNMPRRNLMRPVQFLIKLWAIFIAPDRGV